jgi:hypothetical protein
MKILLQLLKKEKVPVVIDSYVFSQIMVELGCAKKIDLENDASNEFKKIEEIWMFLYLCA